MGLAGLAGTPGVSGIVPGVVAGSPAISIPVMTSAVSPSPYVVTESSIAGTQAGWMAFSGTNSSWTSGANDTASAHITIDLGTTYTVSELTVWAGNFDDSRMPTSWRLFGSNDGTNFTVFHVQSSYSFPALSQPGPTISFPPVEFRYVRFQVNSVNGGFRSSVSQLIYA